jgi:ADP-heptose:LPS heptosyltransferase
VAPRVLIANPGHLGDVLLTLPAVNALRAARPDARLAMLVRRPYADVPLICPHVDEVIAPPFPRVRPNLAALDAAEGDRGLVALEGRFDVAILCRCRDPWRAELATLAGIPARVGYAVAEMEPFLTHGVRFDGRPHTAIQALRLVQRAAADLGMPAASGARWPTTSARPRGCA